MKGKAELPAIPLLFAVLGGLQAFGFVGLVIGPLLLGLVKTAVDIYRESFTPPEAAAADPLDSERQPATGTPGAQVSA
jgi:predicted PurR-regulated permease PerM